MVVYATDWDVLVSVENDADDSTLQPQVRQVRGVRGMQVGHVPREGLGIAGHVQHVVEAPRQVAASLVEPRARRASLQKLPPASSRTWFGIELHLRMRGPGREGDEQVGRWERWGGGLGWDTTARESSHLRAQSSEDRARQEVGE